MGLVFYLKYTFTYESIVPKHVGDDYAGYRKKGFPSELENKLTQESIKCELLLIHFKASSLFWLSLAT